MATTIKKALKRVRNQKQQKLKSMFHRLRYMFPRESNLLALGGSIAMEEQGFITRTAGDLDIMVSEKAKFFIDFVKKLAALTAEESGSYGSYDGFDCDMGVLNHYKIAVKNEKICVFVHKHSDHLKHTTFVGNVRMVKPIRVLEAKKLYVSRLSKTHDSYLKHKQDIKEIAFKLYHD